MHGAQALTPLLEDKCGRRVYHTDGPCTAACLTSPSEAEALPTSHYFRPLELPPSPVKPLPYARTILS